MAVSVKPLTGERIKGETAKATQACNDYLRMGPGRSLAKLARTYAESGPQKPPTRHLATLKKWSSRYNWQDRARAYDAAVEAEKNRRAAEHRRQIMEEGFALDHERVKELKALAVLLGAEILDEDKRWLPDVKQIGGGESAERVDIVRFNSALIDQFRGLLDDIAKEVGDRQRQGTADNPVHTVEMTLGEWRERQAEQARLADETIAAFEDGEGGSG